MIYLLEIGEGVYLDENNQPSSNILEARLFREKHNAYLVGLTFLTKEFDPVLHSYSLALEDAECCGEISASLNHQDGTSVTELSQDVYFEEEKIIKNIEFN